MKILSADQIRELDTFTITREHISSIQLMERAASACVDWITNKFDLKTEFIIVCGLGNNGGDGLAIARLLAERKHLVHTIIINHSEKRSPDFLYNCERLKLKPKSNVKCEEISTIESFNDIFKYNINTVCIDAILGTGLNKPTDGLISSVINCMNQASLPKIAIDIPSGLFSDKLNESKDVVLKADFTLTFQLPKQSFMFIENYKYTGEFSILDIDLNNDFIAKTTTTNYFITKKDIALFIKSRNKIAHKNNFGHALLIAGSKGKMGAAVLSAKACMHSGVGLLTVHSPKCGYEILQTSLPEAMVIEDAESDFVSGFITTEKYTAIGIGPGIGTEKQTQNAIKLLIQNSPVPLIVDADAINIISENKTWTAFLPANSIFTPHLKEFERLVGPSKNSMERLKIQTAFSVKNSVYVILKGKHTSISCPNGDMYFNSTGNPGMATAGSGDVLTGILTGLMAQGYSSIESCIMGVFLHGLAGDFAAKNKSEESMIASDIIENLSEGFKFLKK